MKILIISSLTILLFFSGCLRSLSVKKVEDGYEIFPGDIEVEKVEIKPWIVGPKGKQTITRGIGIKLSIPEIDSDTSRTLKKEYNIDSLLLEINHVTRGNLHPIGAMTIPLGQEGVKILHNVYFNVLYYSATIRPSYTEYSCVPFNQSYLIHDVEINKKPSYSESFKIGALQEENYKNIVLPFRFHVQNFSPGTILVGEFHMRLAFYSSQEKKVKSSFYDYNQYVSVSNEEAVMIKGCENHLGDGTLRFKGKRFRWKKD